MQRNFATIYLITSVLLGQLFLFPLAEAAPPAKNNCNAFDKWSKARRELLPKEPRALTAVLKEGAPLPTGENAVRIANWQKQIEPFARIVEDGCQCSFYVEPTYKTGQAIIGPITDVNMVLAAVEKYLQLRVKQHLAAGEFAQVPSGIAKIFAVARTKSGGSMVLVDYVLYRNSIKRGLESIRECLRWQAMPEVVLKQLPPLMNGLVSRETAVRALDAEVNFFVPQIAAQNPSAPVTDADVAAFTFLAESSGGKILLKRILQERAKDLDSRSTISLIRKIATEGGASTYIAAPERSETTNRTMSKLKAELQPVTKLLLDPNTPSTFLARTPRFENISNLVGKLTVLDYFSRDASSPSADLQNIPAETYDRDVMRIAGTKILIALNLFERAHHRLPATLDELAATKLVELSPEQWLGYDLKYTPASRALEFLPKSGDEARRAAARRELTWQIPQPTAR